MIADSTDTTADSGTMASTAGTEATMIMIGVRTMIIIGTATTATTGTATTASNGATREVAAKVAATGRIDEAIRLHQQTLADRERLLGADHPRTLTSRHSLAAAYQAAGRGRVRARRR
jgi:hypothetical protein